MSNIFVLISLQDEDMISHCVAHEIAHAFGLFGHSGQVRSVVSPVHGEGEFTRWDKMALRILYDNRLRPGMSRQEAMPLIRQLVSEILVSN